MKRIRLVTFSTGFVTALVVASSSVWASEARADRKIYVDQLFIDDEPRRGLDYIYHWVGGPTDNFCFEGGVNCAIVIFDPDPVNPGDEELHGYVYQ